jgi:hypothetical protein
MESATPILNAMEGIVVIGSRVLGARRRGALNQPSTEHLQGAPTMSSSIPSAAQPFVDIAEGQQRDVGPADVIVEDQPPPASVVGPIRRRKLDGVLVGVGAVAAIVLVVAGALLTWGHNFADDYVGRELSSQNITFPDAATLQADNPALVGHAGQQVTTGAQAEAYASYIAGHLEGIADGQTYADLGTPERAAKAAVQTAKDQGASQATVDELQAKATALTAQRDSLFKGETLRGLLLSTYAWSTIGTIAGIAAIVCFVAAAAMAILVVLGLIHRHRTA